MLGTRGAKLLGQLISVAPVTLSQGTELLTSLSCAWNGKLECNAKLVKREPRKYNGNSREFQLYVELKGPVMW